MSFRFYPVCELLCMVLGISKQHKGNKDSSFRNPVVDDERIRRCRQLVMVNAFGCSFTAFLLLELNYWTSPFVVSMWLTRFRQFVSQCCARCFGKVFWRCKIQDNIFKILFMAALHSRCGHYIFALWFLSFYLFMTVLCNRGAIMFLSGGFFLLSFFYLFFLAQPPSLK